MKNQLLLTIVLPCYNEESNIKNLYIRLSNVISSIEGYKFEIIFIDNYSSDNTVSLIKEIIIADKRVKLIVNNQNYGHVRSPYWGILQARGDACIYMASDLQDPPEMIGRFIAMWECGCQVVLGTKINSKTNFAMHLLRTLYYKFLNGIAEYKIIENATGFGIYDKKVIEEIRAVNDPYPFFRGLISELGFKIETIEFGQERRGGGFTKNNLITLYDFAILGIISQSRVPIRIISMTGIFILIIDIIIALIYFYKKMTDWGEFQSGVTPLIIIQCLMFGLLFLFLGLIAEYLYLALRYVKNRPIVIEKERVNFED